MLFKDSITKENLLKYYVKTEKNNLYLRAVNELQNKEFIVLAIVCGGRKGLFQLFDNIPLQMCQFHKVPLYGDTLQRIPNYLLVLSLKRL